MSHTVVILDANAAHYAERLQPQHPHFRFHATDNADEALAHAASANALIGLAHQITPALIGAAPRLRWVQALTTGTDSLTAPGVLPSGVILTSLRGVHGPQMSELAFLHMLALLRDFPAMRDNQMRGVWQRWPQRGLAGKTIVIVGIGVIAEHLAERCKLFGMTTLGISGGRRTAPHFDEVHPRDALASVAARADVLMLLVPYAPDTHHLVDARVLAAMKRDAILVNLARGRVLDEAALIEHLEAGRIAGAGLDIFAVQPLPPDHPLWRMPNVIITPNIGGSSDRIVEQALTVLEPNMRAFAAGRLEAMVNRVRH